MGGHAGTQGILITKYRHERVGEAYGEIGTTCLENGALAACGSVYHRRSCHRRTRNGYQYTGTKTLGWQQDEMPHRLPLTEYHCSGALRIARSSVCDVTAPSAGAGAGAGAAALFLSLGPGNMAPRSFFFFSLTCLTSGG